jgi:dephospho-CoA kinase
MDKLIIGLTGQLAAGKTTVAKYLAEKYQGQVYGFSRPLRDIIDRLTLVQTRENMANLSSILRNQFGQDIILRAIMRDVQNESCQFILLEGMRRYGDFMAFKEFPNFHLIAVLGEQELRYQRLAQRNQNSDDAGKTLEQFKIDEQGEAELDIPKAIAEAEFTIDNNGDLTALYEQAEAIYQKLTAGN